MTDRTGLRVQWFRWLVAVAALAVLGTSCTQGSRPSLPPPAPGDTPVWMLGDSLAWATAARMRPLPSVAAVGGSGFTSSAMSLILDETIQLIDLHDDPTHVLVMGGVNDMKPGVTTQDVVNGMLDLEAHMTSLGITTIWIAQPGWAYADRLDPIADWINTQPNSIDCRAVAGNSNDGIHPANFAPMAACIDAELVAMGVIWTND